MDSVKTVILNPDNSLINFIVIGLLFIVSLFFIIKVIFSYDNKYEHLKISFSNKIYKDFLEKSFKHSKRMALIYIYLHNDSGDYEKDNIIKNLLTSIYDRYFLELRVFRIDEQSLAICVEDYDLLNEIGEDLVHFLEEEQSKYNRFRRIVSTIVAVDDIHLVNTYEEIEILLKNYCSLRSSSNVEASIIHFDESIIRSIQEEIDVSNEIEYIIQNNSVDILLQPIYSVEENKYIAAEAFMYLHDRTGKIMKPKVFIPAAIKYNKMKALGACVIKKVCEFFEKLSVNNIDLNNVFINVSGNELEDPEYLNMIIQEVSSSNIEINKFAIELNNIDSIKHKESFLSNLNSIRLFGIPIAISGFGGADSRIDEITNLPVEIVKLDVSIISKAESDEKASIIIKEILALANNLGMQTIAVGVESEKQAQHMIELGVKYIQGRYYSDSLTPNEFISMFDKVKGAE